MQPNQVIDPLSIEGVAQERRERVRVDQIPLSLELGDHYWCVATLGHRDGRWTKVPTSISGLPIPAKPAFATRDLDKVIAAFHRFPLAVGIGLVLAPESDLCVVDFDHALGPNGWHPQMLEWVKLSGAYAEVSSSGDGVHLFLSAKDAAARYPNRAKRVVNGLSVERYTRDRFIACTFQKLAGSGDDIANGDLTLLDIEVAIGETADSRALACDGLPPSVDAIHYFGERSRPMTDEAVIRHSKRARNRRKFLDLFYRGDLSGYDGDHSRADQALFGILTLYTQEPVQLERIFGLSALGQRDKWLSRDDYRTRCIVTALRNHGLVE